ncbi:potassium transporter TrkA [Paenibacillus chitinolyticus]|uniref:potassium transporter TrkA n=1 Tax=Paenibacillus chitinolyticus TaxID=79263 RepID=UPI0036D907E4
MELLLIVIYLGIVLLVIEISAVLMMLTGLDNEIARFQVTSLLTGTGFTTQESELIIRHPVRRRIGIFLILFGVFSLAVIITLVSNLLEKRFRLPELLVITGILVFLLLVLKLKPMQERLSKKLHAPLEEDEGVEELPVSELLYNDEEDWIIDIPVIEKSEFEHCHIDDLCTANEDINLLFVQRGSLRIRRRGENSDTRLEAGDVLYVYGNKKQISEKFSKELEHRHENLVDENKTVSLL